MPGQTPEKGPGKHRKMLDPGEYRKKKKKVESQRVPKRWNLGEYQKCGIRASTRNVGSGRVPEMWDPSEYQKCGIWASTRNVGSGRVPER